LTLHRFGTIIGAARYKTWLILKNFALTRKKDLTFVAFALKMAHATPSNSHFGFALAPARQNFRKVKG
jgi:hypothetical protein